MTRLDDSIIELIRDLIIAYHSYESVENGDDGETITCQRSPFPYSRWRGLKIGWPSSTASSKANLPPAALEVLQGNRFEIAC